MRITLHFQYRNYPLSKELTEKSKRIGTLTHPLFGVVLGVFPGVLTAMLLPPSFTLPMLLLYSGMIVTPILLVKYRKKKFAQLDAEYVQYLKSFIQSQQGIKGSTQEIF